MVSISNSVKDKTLVKTYIVFRQEVERAKHFVVLKLKALGSLKVTHVRAEGRSLWDLLGTPLCLILLLTVGMLGRRDARTPAGATVVVVGVSRVR